MNDARDRPVAACIDAPLDEVWRTLASAPQGLAAEEAAHRAARYGPNEAAPRRRGAAALALLAFLGNPLVLILLLAAAVSALLREFAGASIIAVIVTMSVALNFVLSYRSQRAAERLRDEIAPTASVRRDGAWRELPRRELVPGDVIRLGAGDRVPADARLFDARSLYVQQAALTGESAPVEKAPDDRPRPATVLAEARHVVLLGTSVVSGTAQAVVFATGRATAFGDVAALLSARPPETEFERGLANFASLIMRTVVFLLLSALLIGVARGRDPLESLMFAVALAVGLTPEFLPMIVTVTLARGAVRMARQRVIVKHLAAIEDFGSMQLLLCDKTATLTTGETRVEAGIDADGQPSARLLDLAYLNSLYESGIRSPFDSAILAHGDASRVAGYARIDEIPFDFERRRLSVVAVRDGARVLVTKGAPAQVLERCAWHERGERREPMDAALRSRCLRLAADCGQRGRRGLAVAWREVPAQPAYRGEDEIDLVFAGFVTFTDPLVPGIAATLAALRRDGVHLKILSGDDAPLVQRVCAQVGLGDHPVVTGAGIDRLGDAALGHLAERTTAFARVSPAQKHRILLALKARGHVIGFLGDGVNDAPSLHAADVGISVANAVDVAKDSADIVLRERDLGVLHDGVLEGRRAFANVMKYLLMATSSNFGNMFSMAVGVLFLPFLPMTPVQILLNNFLYDIAQTTLPTDAVDAAAVRKPQRWNVAQIRNFMLAIGPISSLYDFLTFYVLLVVFGASAALFQAGWFVESLTTQTLVVFVIRTLGNPLRSRPSTTLVLASVGVTCLAWLLPFTPLAALLGFERPPAAYYAFVLAAAATYLALVAAVRRRVLAWRSSPPRRR
ncbi:MAG: magnesium-translocating P-type ATPase [Mizugakiibacter sp.]|uniref:magnesium-translocating P-type ATPase n=1 Tax=Mizugakiibacter sp. TaxID=1972610 RepID=UPI0032105530